MQRLQQICALGQQIWLDNLSHRLLATHHLAQLIRDAGVSGVTSNPAIFYQAISQDPYYQDKLVPLRQSIADGERRFEQLVLADVQAACDLLHELFIHSDKDKGYVSFEVSPRLADDSDATLSAAKRLAALIDRPNLMIKIPATAAGVVALEEALVAGININATLLFSKQQVQEVFTAYQRALQRRQQQGLANDSIRLVASVFISRVDTLVDSLLPDTAAHLRGKIAIASAKAIYQYWQKHYDEAHFGVYLKNKAKAPRLLWASTATKNPTYSDVLYVESLIAPGTINTLADATLMAFAEHGCAQLSMLQESDIALQQLASLQALGIDLVAVGEQLQQQGIALFAQAFDKLLALM